MKTITLIAAVFSVTALSACGGGGGGGVAPTPTRSGFTTVTGATANATLTNERNRSVTRAAVGTAAYTTGIDQAAGQMVAVSGVRAGANTGAAITNGQATYNTSYGYGVIDSITRTQTLIRGTRGEETGTLTLTADFDRGTLTGNNGELTVNGTVNGTTVGGTATANYNFGGFGTPVQRGSVRGPLSGQIGDNGVVGAFHGSDANTVMAGGLVGTKN